MRRAAIFIVLVASPGYAHQTPAVLGPAGPSADPLALVRIAHGVAIRGEGGHRFGCPASWAGPERPLAAGGVIFGADGTYRGDETLAPLEGVFALTVHRDVVTALVRDGSSSRVVEIGTRVTERFVTSARLDDIAAYDGAIFLAGVDGEGGLRIVELASDGHSATTTIAADLRGASVELAAADALYVRARDGRGTRIGRIEADAIAWIATSSAVLFGPTLVDGVLYVVDDGRLVRRDGDAWSIVDETRRYTCLSRRHACTLDALYALDGEGVHERVFQMSSIAPPASDDAECRAQWIDFASEAGLATTVDAPIEPAGGCRSTGGAVSPSLLIPLLVADRRRRRRRER